MIMHYPTLASTSGRREESLLRAPWSWKKSPARKTDEPNPVVSGRFPLLLYIEKFQTVGGLRRTWWGDSLRSSRRAMGQCWRVLHR